MSVNDFDYRSYLLLSELRIPPSHFRNAERVGFYASPCVTCTSCGVAKSTALPGAGKPFAGWFSIPPFEPLHLILETQREWDSTLRLAPLALRAAWLSRRHSPGRENHSQDGFLFRPSNPSISSQKQEHPLGCSCFWRREWDSNPRYL